MPDTIFAIASGEGRSAIAVLRISGPAAGTAIASLAARQASGFDGGMPSPRRANVRMLYHPQTGAILDEALALWFPAPHSFTGEDCLELHIHGGPAVRKAVIDALASLEGFRPARPGEFTRRAFANGKFDLVELEALADLIDAETELQRQQALAGYRGTFASKAAGWRERLVYLIATVEAHLDFADEGDAPEDPFAGTGEELQTIIGEMESALQQARFGELIRRGARVVIAGLPNAGKSSLLNALARRDVALVSSKPGTTRDVLEVRLDLDGLEVCVFDTAGLRETSDEVEAMGIDRALEAMMGADLVLELCPADEPEAKPSARIVGLGRAHLAIKSKIDLLEYKNHKNDEYISLSVRTGEGISELLTRVRSILLEGWRSREEGLLVNERQRVCVERSAGCLRDCQQLLQQNAAELVSQHLMDAVQHLDELAGRVDSDHVLDVIFSRFCMGK